MGNHISNPNITIEVHLNGQNPETLREEIRDGLLSSPRRLPTKYFYDDRGSELFEQICELPEYYQTRTEHKILRTIADEVIALTKAEELVELGSGAATKTRVLLDAMSRANHLRFYVPFDVSEGIVRRVAQELSIEYKKLRVHGVVGDFLTHLKHIPEGGRRLVVLLGGTIGNMSPDAASAFLSSIQEEMSSGDFLLLGVQLITGAKRIEAAYNDVAGVTAKFNKNILCVMREKVGADFNLKSFEHIARYNREQHRIEMYLRALHDQVVHLHDLVLTIHMKEGEKILTEISTKYNRLHTENLLANSGFDMTSWYTDPEQLNALALARKP